MAEPEASKVDGTGDSADETEDATDTERVLFDRDIIAAIFRKLAIHDLTPVSQVCRIWWEVANDKTQLRAWTLDDNILDLVGVKASITPMKPKTPLPKHWVNPTAASPFSFFKTPRSLDISFSTFSPATREVIENASGGSPSALHSPTGTASPRTPSPIQTTVEAGKFFSETVRRNVRCGRFIGDVDISSSRLGDKVVQTIFKNCPNLHTLRLQHICRSREFLRERARPPNAEPAENPGQDSASPLDRCGCEKITERAFRNVATLCPDITSVTLVLEHTSYRKILRATLAEIGALPKLHTLSIELRMPSFSLSIKSEYLWLENARFGDTEVYALLEAGPPPLQALALNRVDVSERCVAELAEACPKLEAIELDSPDLSNLGWSGIFPTVGVQLKALKNLTAGALGIFTKVHRCQFESWCLPALSRLRLETREPLSAYHLSCLLAGCPKLESLHLIWDTHKGLREFQVCPLTEMSILEYKNSL